MPFAVSGVSSRRLADSSADGGLSSTESSVVALVNGTEAYAYDKHLGDISLSHPAFRAAGSSGASEAADWIARQFEGFGLQVEKEEFQFTCWDLKSHPEMVIDADGNPDTVDDQVTTRSFQCEHYSWPTPPQGVFSNVVVLPLPAAIDRSRIGVNPIDTSAWEAINTSAKVVLIGREVCWDQHWEQTFRNKLAVQTPAAIVFTWWYDWLASIPNVFPSAGGRPLDSLGSAYYWNLQIPIGSVDYGDGLLIRSEEKSLNISARVTIDSTVTTQPQYNVVAKLNGQVSLDPYVILCGHYDTVMTPGFCDDGTGISGIIETAKILSKIVKEGLYSPKYTVAFVAFSGEEIGLVGSINYVMRHKDQMNRVAAVVNLDCIGSGNLSVTRTESVMGFNLSETILNAAQALGIAAELQDPGGSDQESFRFPAWADSYYRSCWAIEANISSVKPVKASAMIASDPLSFSDGWNLKNPGWIHTSYDSSSSTQTLNRVTTGILENHIKVAALTIIRVSPLLLRADLDGDGSVSIVDLLVVKWAFRTKPGNFGWNPIADLDRNGVVNILDLSIVAKDYGKASWPAYTDTGNNGLL